MTKTTNKGFIIDQIGNRLLPITRGELVLDSQGQVALHSSEFLASEGLPGLVTAAERALLSGSTGGGLSDLSDKLGYINNGLMVNSSVLNFYNSQGNPTPINIIKGSSNTVEIVVNDNNVVSLDLVNINATAEVSNSIVKNVSVDTYGRVTAIQASSLTDADIPSEISGKTIKSSVLSACTTDGVDIGTQDTAVANKAYVDSKVAQMSGLATGALKFGGSVSSQSFAISILNADDTDYNYYKVTAAFNLPVDYLYDKAGISQSAENCSCKIGDTLIVYPIEDSTSKYIYIPSGNEDMTYLTVTGEAKSSGEIVTPALSNESGNVQLKFSSIFSVVNNPVGSKTAYVSIPQVTTGQSGYLSSTDYATFKNYATTLAVSYVPNGQINSNYNIGQLTIGSQSYTIGGLNSTYTFSLNNGYTTGANLTKDPILKVAENDTNIFNLTFKGIQGVVANKNGNVIEFSSDISVDEASENFVSVTNGHVISVNTGYVSEGSVIEGITPYSEFNTFKQQVLLGTIAFEYINRSLKDTATVAPEGQLFYYGSDDLKDAINVTI